MKVNLRRMMADAHVSIDADGRNTPERARATRRAKGPEEVAESGAVAEQFALLQDRVHGRKLDQRRHA